LSGVSPPGHLRVPRCDWTPLDSTHKGPYRLAHTRHGPPVRIIRLFCTLHNSDRLPNLRQLPPMSNNPDPEHPAHLPLSSEEVARAVDRLGQRTLDLPRPTSAVSQEHNLGELRRMTAAQRFWLAFTGKPGSSGRAGPAHEPGQLRGAPRIDVDSPFGIPHQRKATD